MKQSMLVLVPAIVALAGIRAFAGEDEQACEGKMQGDACGEGDGDRGVCQPDQDDGVLECRGQ